MVNKMVESPFPLPPPLQTADFFLSVVLELATALNLHVYFNVLSVCVCVSDEHCTEHTHTHTLCA